MVKGSTGGQIIEVGAGTGLFSRTLATAFGPDFRVLALEPNDDMRRHAELATPAGLSINYANGIAEHLSVDDSSIQLLVAASAVHRFNRPLFYHEARRVLATDGVLAFVQYEPDDKGSSFADGFLSIVETALPNYKRRRSSRPGGGYFDLDLTAELKAERAFKDIERHAFVFAETIDWDMFSQRALSFTIVQKAIASKGEDTMASDLRQLFADHQTPQGRVEMPFEAEVITARLA